MWVYPSTVPSAQPPILGVGAPTISIPTLKPCQVYYVLYGILGDLIGSQQAGRVQVYGPQIYLNSRALIRLKEM